MVRGRLEDRRDQLRLLALAARGAGFDKDLQDYVPPSEQLTEDLAQLAVEPRGATDRQLEILRFVAETGGG